MNGRCVGNVYEWCDYSARGIRKLDCAALGMDCEALESQNYEDELNGCSGSTCDGSEPSRCEGTVKIDCQGNWGWRASDCRKLYGADSTCEVVGGEAHCTDTACEDLSGYACDGTLSLICNEEGVLWLTDCARCDPTATCSEGAPLGNCTAPTFGCTNP